MVFVPIPADAGLKILAETPGPEYVPIRGIPPFSLNGLAFRVVTVSKQVVKVTTGIAPTFMVIVLDVAGFPIGQAILELRMHWIWSPATGI